MKHQTRSAETRAHELRNLPFNFDPDQSVSHPAGCLPDDYDGKYISINKIEDSIKMGYELVSIDKQTNSKFSDPSRKNPLSDSYPTLKDTVYGIIPKHYKKQIDNYYEKKANDAIKLPGVKDTAMPVNRF